MSMKDNKTTPLSDLRVDDDGGGLDTPHLGADRAMNLRGGDVDPRAGADPTRSLNPDDPDAKSTMLQD